MYPLSLWLHHFHLLLLQSQAQSFSSCTLVSFASLISYAHSDILIDHLVWCLFLSLSASLPVCAFCLSLPLSASPSQSVSSPGHGAFSTSLQLKNCSNCAFDNAGVKSTEGLTQVRWSKISNCTQNGMIQCGGKNDTIQLDILTLVSSGSFQEPL